MRTSGGRGRADQMGSARKSRNPVQRRVSPSQSSELGDKSEIHTSVVNGKNSHIHINLNPGGKEK